jgi:hypothetical protein
MIGRPCPAPLPPPQTGERVLGCDPGLPPTHAIKNYLEQSKLRIDLFSTTALMGKV